MKLIIDFKKLGTFLLKTFKLLFTKNINKMNPLQEISNTYFAKLENQASLDAAVQTAIINLQPFQNELDVALQAQSDNAKETAALKEQLLAGFSTEVSNVVTPVEPVVKPVSTFVEETEVPYLPETEEIPAQ